MTLTASADIVRPSVSNQPLSQEELRKMNAYWRAANYLSVGQIYLYANPLPARSLGYDARTELYLCALQPPN